MSVVDAMTIYEIARDRLQRSPFRAEIDWQASVNPIEFTESDLLRECAWVILCSGFRESVVRRAFPFISLCFCYWESSESICRKSDYCRSTALSAFGNKRKIQAILDVAAHIYNFGFCEFKNQILSEPLVSLQVLPFIGKVTATHVAKNLGFDVAKADRHLTRLASSAGFTSAQDLCAHIAKLSGDPIRVVDLILWRHIEQSKSANSRLGAGLC